MTRIYLLADAHLPDAEVIERLLKAGIGERYGVQAVESRDALQACLAEARRAVVFFSAAPDALGPFVQWCRKLLPGVACVAVADERDAAGIPVLETDCHFIRRPADGFSVLSQLSLAVRQAELLSLQAESGQTDEVTNLYNRRYFMQRLGEEISLSRRHLSPLCCIALSINFYKIYLDSYGYDFTNALLRFIADRINATVRHEDIVARIGDDELGLILPRSTEKGAKVFVNRLILELNASVFRHDGYEEEISVCAGLAGYPLPDSEARADADALVRYARHALHQAKCAPEDSIRVRLFSEIKPAL